MVNFPIVAMGIDFWGKIDALRDAALAEGTISDSDRELFFRTDDVEEAVREIARCDG
jgi:predicted Rossmann-fold nucleotide-binding protein